MINKRFTYGRADGNDDIKHNRKRKWDVFGYSLIEKDLKHFSSEYISGYTSAYDMKVYLERGV